VYLKQLVYDKFEQRTHLAMGNGVTTDYTYNAKTQRLKTLQSQVPGAPTKLQDNLYVYDLVGNITELHNNAQVPPRNDMGGPTNQTFHYDSLYRLVSANGDYTAAHETHKYTLGMSYDAIHNITRKTQNHTVIRNGGKALEQRKTTYDWVYRYGASGNDSRQSHAPIQIGTPDANGNPVGRSFTYDANGNQEGWTNDTNGTRRAIVWDEENRIQEVQDPQHTESYSYNDQGQRMVRRSKYGETAYINQFFTVRNGAITSTHIYAGTTRLASKVNAGTPISDTSVSGSTSTTTTTVFNTSESSTQPGNGKGQGPTEAANIQDHQNNSNGNKGGARLNGNPGQGRDKRSDTANEHAQDIYKNPTLTGELPGNNKGNNGHNGKGHGAGNGGGSGGSGSGNGGNTTGNGNGYGSNKTNTGSGREFLYYYHPDHLGSSSYVTDANAERYEHIEYFPFGETWVEESSNTWRTPYLFTSKEMDPQTQLYYYGARYYDPRTSVWQSADPILGKYLDGAGNSGGVFNSMNLDLYTYTHNSPVVYFDPNGEDLVPGLKKMTYEQTTKAYPSWGAYAQLDREGQLNYFSSLEKNIKALVGDNWKSDAIKSGGSCATKASVTTNGIDPKILKDIVKNNANVRKVKDTSGNNILIGAKEFGEAVGLKDPLYKVDTHGGENLDSIKGKKGWIYFDNYHVDLWDGNDMYANGPVPSDGHYLKTKNGKPRDVYFAPLSTAPLKTETESTE